MEIIIAIILSSVISGIAMRVLIDRKTVYGTYRVISVNDNESYDNVEISFPKVGIDDQTKRIVLIRSQE